MYIACPKCEQDRQKRGTKSLSVLCKDGVITVKCFHDSNCEWSIPTVISQEEFENIGVDVDSIGSDEKIVGQPIPENLIPMNDDRNVYYVYRNVIGEGMLIVHRVNRLDGSKKIFPMYYNGTDLVYGTPNIKILYNSDLINKYKDATVLVVEGEKAAEYAQKVLLISKKKVIVTTWPLGCSNVNKGDWELLKNRDVILWPDKDEQGINAMARVERILMDEC